MLAIFNKETGVHTDIRDDKENTFNFEIWKPFHSKKLLSIHCMIGYYGLNISLGNAKTSKEAIGIIENYYNKNYSILCQYKELRELAENICKSMDKVRINEISYEKFNLVPSSKLTDIRVDIHRQFKRVG